MSKLFSAKEAKPQAVALSYLIVAVLLIGFFWLSLSLISYKLDFSFIPDVQIRILDGLGLTLAISLVSLVVSLIFGALVAAGELSDFLPLKLLAELYVKIIRGTPLMAQIYLFFYIVGTAWHIENRFVAGVIILSIFEAAYIAEIFRGSYLSIDKDQLLAAESVGFTKRQSFRYIVLPQLAARTLPALSGQFASIIKDSSLLSLIAVIEISQTMREISSANFRLFECYLLLAALYLLLTLPISLISSHFEKKLSYETHA